MAKRTTIKFGTQDVVHQYHPTGKTVGGTRGDPLAIHGHRATATSPGPPSAGISGLPSISHADSYPPPLSITAPGARVEGSTSRDLLSESPTEPTSQILSIPPLPPRSPGAESIPYSAPPTQNPSRSKPGRKDSRELFGDSPGTGTLLSFPSVTDSARSWDGDAANDSWQRGRGTKKYPKGDKEVDREESVSLWQREGDEASGEDSEDLNHGGIRLVTPPSKGGSSRF